MIAHQFGFMGLSVILGSLILWGGGISIVNIGRTGAIGAADTDKQRPLVRTVLNTKGFRNFQFRQVFHDPLSLCHRAIPLSEIITLRV